MKYLIENFSANIVSLACVGFAGYLMVNDKTGWGWFLLIALLCCGPVTKKL